MQCGGTQTRRQQERRGTPKAGRGAARGAERSAPRLAPLSGCPAPLLPSPGLRSDPAQCNKSSPKVILTQALSRSSPKVILTQAPESCSPMHPVASAFLRVTCPSHS